MWATAFMMVVMGLRVWAQRCEVTPISRRESRTRTYSKLDHEARGLRASLKRISDEP